MYYVNLNGIAAYFMLCHWRRSDVFTANFEQILLIIFLFLFVCIE